MLNLSTYEKYNKILLQRCHEFKLRYELEYKKERKLFFLGNFIAFMFPDLTNIVEKFYTKTNN